VDQIKKEPKKAGIYDLKHEDFIASPKAVLKELYRFLNLAQLTGSRQLRGSSLGLDFLHLQSRERLEEFTGSRFFSEPRQLRVVG
jgi:hypothetical protein